jgi:HSP20 family protein
MPQEAHPTASSIGDPEAFVPRAGRARSARAKRHSVQGFEFSSLWSGNVIARLHGGAVARRKEEAMRALTPWTGMSSLRREMDRVFDRVFDWEPAWAGPEVGGEWAPKVDLSETKDAFLVRAEIPGVEQKDMQVSLQDLMLTIKGEKAKEKEAKDEHYHRMESSYGSFVRAMRLPTAVDGSKVTATFKDGVLMVTLPKTPAAKGTMIPIKAA